MLLNRFSYIIQPETAGSLEADVRNLLESNGKAKTFVHVSNVAATCAQIGERYHLDGELCRTAGLLHDVSAVIRPADMLEYAHSAGLELCEAEERHPFLLHQRLSAQIATERFGVCDARLLSAIDCHTTLKPRASLLDMALFLADKLAWDQEGVPPFSDDVRSALDHSPERACLAYITYMNDSGRLLFPHVRWTQAARWLKDM